MATSLADLRTQVRYRVRDTNDTDYFWVNDEVDAALAAAIRALWPDMYIRKVQVSGSTGEKLTFDLPSGCERLGKVEIKDASYNFVEIISWEEDTGNGQVVFPKMPRQPWGALRFTWRGKFNVTTPDHPEYCDEAVIMMAAAVLYNKRIAWRADSSKYSARLKKDAATVEELLKIKEGLEQSFHTFLDANRMPPIESERRRDARITEGVQPAHSGRRRKAEARANVEPS